MASRLSLLRTAVSAARNYSTSPLKFQPAASVLADKPRRSILIFPDELDENSPLAPTKQPSTTTIAAGVNKSNPRRKLPGAAMLFDEDDDYEDAADSQEAVHELSVASSPTTKTASKSNSKAKSKAATSSKSKSANVEVDKLVKTTASAAPKTSNSANDEEVEDTEEKHASEGKTVVGVNAWKHLMNNNDNSKSTNKLSLLTSFNPPQPTVIAGLSKHESVLGLEYKEFKYNYDRLISLGYTHSVSAGFAARISGVVRLDLGVDSNAQQVAIYLHDLLQSKSLPLSSDPVVLTHPLQLLKETAEKLRKIGMSNHAIGMILSKNSTIVMCNVNEERFKILQERLGINIDTPAFQTLLQRSLEYKSSHKAMATLDDNEDYSLIGETLQEMQSISMLDDLQSSKLLDELRTMTDKMMLLRSRPVALDYEAIGKLFSAYPRESLSLSLKGILDRLTFLDTVLKNANIQLIDLIRKHPLLILPFDDFENVIHFLMNNGVSQQQLYDVIRRQPAIVTTPLEELKPKIMFYELAFGISVNEIFKSEAYARAKSFFVSPSVKILTRAQALITTKVKMSPNDCANLNDQQFADALGVSLAKMQTFAKKVRPLIIGSPITEFLQPPNQSRVPAL